MQEAEESHRKDRKLSYLGLRGENMSKKDLELLVKIRGRDSQNSSLSNRRVTS